MLGFIITVILIGLVMIVGAIFLFRLFAKTKHSLPLVFGILLCAAAVLGLAGLAVLCWLLSQNPYPYT